MLSFVRRYAIAIVDQKSGIERRATVSVGHVLVVAVVMIALPLLILFGAAWKTRGGVQGLYASHLELELEAANYRVAIEALTRQMGSQQSTLADLSVNSAGSSASARLNPAAATSVVRSRPGGGERGANVAVDRWAVREALARSGHTRTVAEGADAPALASGLYRAGVDLQLQAEELVTAGRINAALVRAVEADARFRAAEIEARAQAAARERARLADALITAGQLPLLELREVAAVPADAPCAESRQQSRAPAPTAADVEGAIREVIAQYVSGLESQSVPALKRVWPSLGGREERAIKTEFENARIVETAFKDPRITINGDTTTVTGLRMHSLVTQDGQRLSSLTRTTMTLRRNGNVWTIEHIVHQQ